MEEIKKDRSITKIDADIKTVLNWKVKHYQDNDVPMGVVSDYISKGIDEVDIKINQLKNYKKLIDDEIKDLTLHKETIKIKSAEWLEENGIDKLEGIEISSITIAKEVEAKEETIIERKFSTNLSKEEINDFIVSNNLGKYEDTEVKEVSAAKPKMIKINKKRK